MILLANMRSIDQETENILQWIFVINASILLVRVICLRIFLVIRKMLLRQTDENSGGHEFGCKFIYVYSHSMILCYLNMIISFSSYK